MEERIEIKKNSLLAFEPVEVKVVEISGQGRLCLDSETKAEAESLRDMSGMTRYSISDL